MKLRLTTLADVDAVMAIIDQGKAYLKSQDIDQWQNGYPNHQTIEGDIESGEAYVLENQSDIVGTAMIAFGEEPTYRYIEGQWLTPNPYAVLHRVAISQTLKGQGLGLTLLDEAEKLCHQQGFSSIRIDTHEANRSMKKMLQKAGFTYCGIIYLDPNEEGDRGARIAYEKVLN